MVIVLGVLLPGLHNEVLAVTLNAPLPNDDPTFNKIVELFCPLWMVVPAGTVHR